MGTLMCSLAETAQLDTTALLPPLSPGRKKDTEGRDLQAIRASLGGLVRLFHPHSAMSTLCPLPHPIPFSHSRSLPGHMLTPGPYHRKLYLGNKHANK